jgi:serine/threonine-protein kinase
MVSADVLAGLEKKDKKGAQSGLMIALGAVLVLGVVFGALYMAGLFGGTSPSPPVANTNTVGPPTPAGPPPGMVLIPGGTFEMGRESQDPYEGPPHEVVVKPFYLDKTEVTNKQYAEFVQATGYKVPTHWVNNAYPVGTGDLPVVNVDWADARAYAEWAKKRLPTEEEWEFAARGTEPRLYPWGDTWVSGNAYTKESKLTTLQPVGSVPSGASPFGILDMSGNVWEWCNDNFKPYPGSKGETRDANFKIIRGGSLGNEKAEATTTYRSWVPPERKYDALGFRCARSVE